MDCNDFVTYGISDLCWGMANGGARRIVRFFWGESVPSKASFGGLRKWDWSGLRPFPLRKMTLREQTGGGGETYPVFANTSLINSKNKIGNGIGNFLIINFQELRAGNFWAILEREGEGH